jgi:predicted hydrocarbon binding protein
MKGVIFIALNDMIVEKSGLAAWITILDQASLDGIYTATENYSDAELFKLVGVISSELNLDQEQTLCAFGEYLFDVLHNSHTMFADSKRNFFDFIGSIDGVIHVEVHKLDNNACPPLIKVIKQEHRTATLMYQSKRKLCHLAVGLLAGAAKHYGIEISIEQTLCMHDDHGHCEFQVTQNG